MHPGAKNKQTENNPYWPIIMDGREATIHTTNRMEDCKKSLW